MTVSTDITHHDYKPGAAMANEALTGLVFFDPDELVVVHQAAATGVPTVLLRGVNYTIGGDGAGGAGTVRALAAWPADDEFHVWRNAKALQEAALDAFEKLDVEAIERALDRIMLVAQDARAFAERAMGGPLWEEAPARFPSKDQRKGKLLAFDGDTGEPTAIDLPDFGNEAAEAAAAAKDYRDTASQYRTDAQAARDAAIGAKDTAVGAATSAINARDTVLAALALQFTATSASSKTFPISGSQVFAVGAGKAFFPSQAMRFVATGDPTKFVEGVVTAYAGGNLTLNVTNAVGSGTIADWTGGLVVNATLTVADIVGLATALSDLQDDIDDKADAAATSAALGQKLNSSAVSTFALTLLDDASAAAMRSTLGLGSAATASTGDFAPASHNHLLTETTSRSGYTLTLADAYQVVPMTGTVTVPPNSSVAYPIGTWLLVKNTAATAQAVNQGAGVTITKEKDGTAGNLSLASKRQVLLRKTGTNTWDAYGGGIT